MAEVESLDLEGRGVARVEGKVVFIEGALPGERVRWEPLRSRARYETGRLAEVLRPSPARVTPRCPHFGLEPGRCGGCSMQHLDPRTQVAIKQRALETTLWHVGRVRPELVLRPVEGLPWNYRQRARLGVHFVARRGGVVVGFHERATSFVAEMVGCEVLAAPADRLIAPLRSLINGLSIRARLPQVEVAIGTEAGPEGTARVLTVLVFRVLEAPTAPDRERLADFAREHGVRVWLQPAGPDSAAPLDAAQAAQLRLVLPEFGLSLPFQPTDFTQVNHRLNEILVRRAVGLLAPESTERVADFFCGLGNFSLPLATRARHVVGLEGSAALVRRAREAAREAGLERRASFAARDLDTWQVADWEELARTHGPIERVLLDPPREGALALVRSLAAAPRGLRRLVYVSCNPATLARDCAVLVRDGHWRLRAAGVVNMFAQTSHVESIAVLEPGPGEAAVVESPVA